MTIKKSIFASPFLYSKDEHEDLFKIDKKFKNMNSKNKKKYIKSKKNSNLLDDFQSGNTNLDDIFNFPSNSSPSSTSLTNSNQSDLSLSLNSSRSIISSTAFASPSSPPPNFLNRNDFSFQDYLNDFNLEHNITGCTPDLDFNNITKTTIVCSTDDENEDSENDDDNSCDSSCEYHNNNQTQKLNKKIKLDSSYRHNKNDFLCESTFQDINSSNEKLTAKDTNLVGDLLYDLSLDELDFQIRSSNKGGEESLDNKENENDLISHEFNKNLKNVINTGNDDEVDEDVEESFDEFLQVENSFNDFEFESMIDANERQNQSNKNKKPQLKQNLKQNQKQAPFIYQDPEHEQGKLRQEINNNPGSRIRLTDNMSDIFNDKLNHFDHNTEDYTQKQIFFKDTHEKSNNSSSNSENYFFEDEHYESGTSDERALNTGRYIENDDDEDEEEEEELRLVNNDNILIDLSSGSSSTNSSGNVSSSSFITRQTLNFSNKPLKKSPGRVCSPSSSRKKIPTRSVLRVRKNLLNLIVDSSDGNLDDATKYATEINSQNCEGIPIPEKTTELVTIPTAGPQIGGIKKAAIVKAILAKSGNKSKHKKLHHSHTHTHTHTQNNRTNSSGNNVKGFYTLDEKTVFIKETNEFFSNKLKDSKNMINITNNSNNNFNSLKNLKEKLDSTITELENQENSISDNNRNNQLSPNKSPLVSPRSKQRHHSHQYNHQLQLKQQREQQLQLQQQQQQQRQRMIKSVKWATELEW